MVKTVVCLGDSNTHGFNAENGGRFLRTERWTGILQEKLGEDFYIVEEGLNGRTCVIDDPITEGLSAREVISPILLTHEPVDLLVVMLGTNDVKERFRMRPYNIKEGMKSLLLKAKSTVGAWREDKPKILLVCPPPILDDYMDRIYGEEMGAGCADKSKALAGLYEALAKEVRCFYLDGGSVEGVSMDALCGMHLSKTSHQNLGKALAGKIEEIFKGED
ncbi:MAG TPA: GDSL-type esterase/lipase family protein [Lachnospiraceae bacterium]